MADENVRRCNSRSPQQRVQFLGHHFAGAWSRTGIAVADTGAIVGTHARELCDLRLHFAPGKVRVSETRLEDDRRTSLPSAVDVHPKSANIEEPAIHRIQAAVAVLRDMLVDRSGNGEDQSEREQTEDDAAGPVMGRRGIVHEGTVLCDASAAECWQAFYMTGGTVMPMTARQRINSRRTTATVANRNCFRFSSGSLRMGWRW